MAEATEIPETFGAAPSEGHSDEVRAILRELEQDVDDLFLKDVERAVQRARVALGLDEQ